MSLAEQFAEHQVGSLDLTRFVRVGTGTKVRAVIAAMNEAKVTCACVCNGAGPIGIVTDRDVLTRVTGYPLTWDMPVEMVMTPEPETVRDRSSAAEALAVMNRYRFRNVPVVNGVGDLMGNLDRFALMRFASAVLFDEATTGEEEPPPQTGRMFESLSGLDLPEPVTIAPDTNLKLVVHTMRGRGIGSLLVVDDRGETVGIFTDHDAQAKVACRVENLSAVAVANVMTREPTSLAADDAIADGLRLMAEHGLSHVPLTSGGTQTVAMVSFRDIADHLESTFAEEA